MTHATVVFTREDGSFTEGVEIPSNISLISLFTFCHSQGGFSVLYLTLYLYASFPLGRM